MKRNLLARLRSNGILYMVSALLLIVGVPVLQALILNPQGFGQALDTTGTGRFVAYLSWIGGHSALFLSYRVLLLVAFALLLTLPLSLYRIIVAQEIVGQPERAEEETDEVDENGNEAEVDEGEAAGGNVQVEKESETDGMPEHAWRGKGFAVLAAWAGLFGVGIYVLGTLASTLYFFIVSNNGKPGAEVLGSVAGVSNIFTLITNTGGIGLIGLSGLFFGAMITRTGRNLWPGIWVAFGYVLLLIGALLCISAVAVFSAPGAGQGTLSTVTTLLFALWLLWLGIMLVRLKAEA